MAWIIKLVLAACMLNAATATYGWIIGTYTIMYTKYPDFPYLVRVTPRINLTDNIGFLGSIALRISKSTNENKNWDIRTYIVVIAPDVFDNSSTEPIIRNTIYAFNAVAPTYGHHFGGPTYMEHMTNTKFGNNYIDFEIFTTKFTSIRIEIFK